MSFLHLQKPLSKVLVLNISLKNRLIQGLVSHNSRNGPLLKNRVIQIRFNQRHVIQGVPVLQIVRNIAFDSINMLF